MTSSLIYPYSRLLSVAMWVQTRPPTPVAANDLVICTGRLDVLRNSITSHPEHSFRIFECALLADGLSAAQAHHSSVVLIGAADDSQETLQSVRALREHDRRGTVILVTSCHSEALAIAALRAGVTGYFTVPLESRELIEDIRRRLNDSAAACADAKKRRPAAWGANEAGPPLIGETRVMRDLREYVSRLAANELSVVITGETGTGKEIVAERLHAQSARRAGRFVAVNCAAIPDALVESELFGYERGAFTGALAPQGGYLEQAHRGTIFFDEIGDMGHQAQAKILRAVERGEVTRLGGRRAVPVDLRVVAATNQDLERAVSDGHFRKDLYFRLNVARVQIPPLRERRDDIPCLVEYYGRRCRSHDDGGARTFTPEALELLTAYDWPGNVRELRNVVDITLMNRPGGVIGVADLPDVFRLKLVASAVGAERQRLLDVLAETNWNKSKAAQTLHWSRMTLYRKLAKYHLLSSSDSV